MQPSFSSSIKGSPSVSRSKATVCSYVWLGPLMPMFARPENCDPSSLTTTKRSLPAGSARLGHFEGVQCALEFVFGQHLFFSRNLANRSSGLGALLGNFRRAIVTDLRREAGHHGHRKLH